MLRSFLFSALFVLIGLSGLTIRSIRRGSSLPTSWGCRLIPPPILAGILMVHPSENLLEDDQRPRFDLFGTRVEMLIHKKTAP